GQGQHQEPIADRQLDDFFDHGPCACFLRSMSSLARASVSAGLAWARLRQFLQHKNTSWPSSVSFTGTPMPPSGLPSSTGHSSSASAAARSAGESFASAAAILPRLSSGVEGRTLAALAADLLPPLPPK